MKIIKSSTGIPFLWMKWGTKFRWISFECSKPIWWMPVKEKYIYGTRIGWLFFAVGTGIVTEEMMKVINSN